jgi:transposase
MVEHFYFELDGLVEAHQRTDQWLREEGKQQPIVKLISTAPGIGLIRASLIVAVILSPERFRTRRQLWAYCGLGVVTYSSSDWRQHNGTWQRTRIEQTRGLNRNRNPILKNVFKAAAFTVLQQRMSEHPLQQAYRRMLATGTKPNLAKLTVARRIAAAVLAMWKNKEKYDSTRQTTLS